MTQKITEQEILAKQTDNGGWTKATLASWGVPWPPPKGWKEALVQHGVPYRSKEGESSYG